MISKVQATAVWTEIDDKAFKEAERRIDAAIKDGGRRISVDMAGVDGLTERVKKRINDLYGSPEGGWAVDWRNGDQRDPGPFVELT